MLSGDLEENKKSEEICEEVIGIEGTADEEPKEQCQKQKHKTKMSTSMNMKSIIKYRRNSTSDPALTPKTLIGKIAQCVVHFNASKWKNTSFLSSSNFWFVL